MKKTLSTLVFLACSIAAFCQADSTATSVVNSITNNIDIWGIVSVIVVAIIGHFNIKGKWWSILQYVEKVLEWLLKFVQLINKTNKQ